jgi:hypothetical protein
MVSSGKRIRCISALARGAATRRREGRCVAGHRGAMHPAGIERSQCTADMGGRERWSSVLNSVDREGWLRGPLRHPRGWIGVVFRRCGAGPGRTARELRFPQVRPNFYMIAGAGANIGVQTGPDGRGGRKKEHGTREASLRGAPRANPEAGSRDLQPLQHQTTSADADVVGGNCGRSRKGPSVSRGHGAPRTSLNALSARQPAEWPRRLLLIHGRT